MKYVVSAHAICFSMALLLEGKHQLQDRPALRHQRKTALKAHHSIDTRRNSTGDLIEIVKSEM